MYLGLLLCNYQIPNSWHLLWKPSPVVPRTSKSAGSAESLCLECTSDQLSVLFRRRNNNADVVYLLSKNKVCPPISIYQKIFVPPSLCPSVKINKKINKGFRQQWIESTSNTRSQTCWVDYYYTHTRTQHHWKLHTRTLPSKLLYHAVNDWVSHLRFSEIDREAKLSALWPV